MGTGLNIPKNLRRAAAQFPIPYRGWPVPDGEVSDYDRRHNLGIGGKGRSIPGVHAFPDPLDRSQDPDSTLKPSFEMRHIPAVLLQLDPSDLLEYFLSIVTREREAYSGAITSFLDLFDPDKCPPAYLPYLARAVGVNLRDHDVDDVALKRQQIREAIPVYKQKGLISAFERLMAGLGYDVSVKHLYLMPPDPEREFFVKLLFAAQGLDLEDFRSSPSSDVVIWPVSS